jgi:hypothetical protein
MAMAAWLASSTTAASSPAVKAAAPRLSVR